MMMDTSSFDAVVDFLPEKGRRSVEAMIVFEKSKAPASVSFYQPIQMAQQKRSFVRIQTGQPMRLRWQDGFQVRKSKTKTLLGKGRVLNPDSERVRGKKVKKRISFLNRLLGDDQDMLTAIVQEKGAEGLWETEAMSFSGFDRSKLISLSQELEARGDLRILSFSPLFLVSKKSVDHLCQKILAFLFSFHQKHPGEQGAPLERVRRRFDVDQKILALACNRLVKERQVRLFEKALALSEFERTLSPQEEKILRQLEELCYKREFRSVANEDLRRTFRLSPSRLNQLLELLIERKKVVQGKEGFLIHSKWLDEVIYQIQNSGKRELTVLDFKKMTGLSRKYAIPLLELLDQMGVTRRKGPKHEVL